MRDGTAPALACRRRFPGHVPSRHLATGTSDLLCDPTLRFPNRTGRAVGTATGSCLGTVSPIPSWGWRDSSGPCGFRYPANGRLCDTPRGPNRIQSGRGRRVSQNPFPESISRCGAGFPFAVRCDHEDRLRTRFHPTNRPSICKSTSCRRRVAPPISHQRQQGRC